MTASHEQLASVRPASPLTRHLKLAFGKLVNSPMLEGGIRRSLVSLSPKRRGFQAPPARPLYTATMYSARTPRNSIDDENLDDDDGICEC